MRARTERGGNLYLCLQCDNVCVPSLSLVLYSTAGSVWIYSELLQLEALVYLFIFLFYGGILLLNQKAVYGEDANLCYLHY